MPDPVRVTAWPAFDRERTSVRVVLLDEGGRLLLFDTHDPTMPEVGSWWELPGGGMKPGEDPTTTAVREVAEETGIVLSADSVSTPTWTRDVTYARRHVRTLQHELVVVAHCSGEGPPIVGSGRTPHERAEYAGHRWWTVDQVCAGGARFFPGRLPDLLPAFLAGERIDEPFEHWN
jgi:8-oxo-dGTP pyrophosphatase MutT (NUDIX family)